MRRAFAIALLASLAAPLAQAETGSDLDARFRVTVNESRALSLPGPVAGVAVGNPEIASVTVQSDRLLFVTGRSHGVTNLVAVDSAGRTVFESQLFVAPNAGSTVTVTRGAASMASYQCNPTCGPAGGPAKGP